MEIRHKNILRMVTLQKEHQTHQNFTDFCKQGIEALDELQNL